MRQSENLWIGRARLQMTHVLDVMVPIREELPDGHGRILIDEK